MRLTLTIVIIFLLISNGFAQDNISTSNQRDFAYYDRESYRLLETARYDSLKIITGEAIDNGHDWFYLRLRRGLAFFYTHKYFDAIRNFEKASKFNHNDSTNNALLGLTLTYTNRYYEAIRINKSFRNTNFSLYTGINTQSPLDNIRNSDFAKLDSVYLEAEYPTSKYFVNPIYEHRLGKMHIQHSLSYMKINNEQYYLTGDKEFIEKDASCNIIDYMLKSAFATKAFTIEPAFHYFRINKTYKVYTPENPMGTNAKNSMNDYLFSLSISKHINILKPEINYSFAKSSGLKSNQAGLTLTMYPGGNLNSNIFVSAQYLNNSLGNKMLFKAGLFAKIINNLYTGANASIGQHSYFNTGNGSIYYNVNNTGEEINQIINYGIYYYPNKNLELSLTFQQAKKDIFVYYDMANDNIMFTMTKENIIFNDYLIFGGVKWKIN